MNNKDREVVTMLTTLVEMVEIEAVTLVPYLAEPFAGDMAHIQKLCKEAVLTARAHLEKSKEE